MDGNLLSSGPQDGGWALELEAPRFENGRTLLIAGLGERYTPETCARIPAQWQRFGPHIGHIPGQVGRVAYGVLCNGDDAGSTEYICGVEVSDFARLPAEWSRVRIPAQRYAVFAHRCHVSGIRRTWFSIFNKWLPQSGYSLAKGPEFERYGEEFDPMTGEGGLTIWIQSRDSVSAPSRSPLFRHARWHTAGRLILSFQRPKGLASQMQLNGHGAFH